MSDYAEVREWLERWRDVDVDMTEVLAAFDRIEAENERLREHWHDPTSGLATHSHAELACLRRIEEAARGLILTLDHSDLYEDPQQANRAACDALRTTLNEEKP